MLEQTKSKSLDELEDLMGGFSREHADDNIEYDGLDTGDKLGAEVRVDERDSSGRR